MAFAASLAKAPLAPVVAVQARPALKASRTVARPSHARVFRVSNGSRINAFKVTLIHEGATIAEFECPADENILEGAEKIAKISDLPYSCRAGSCSSCAGKIISGEVSQDDASFLDDDQKEEGYVLTCVSYPLSDVTIDTHKEEDLF